MKDSGQLSRVIHLHHFQIYTPHGAVQLGDSCLLLDYNYLLFRNISNLEKLEPWKIPSLFDPNLLQQGSIVHMAMRVKLHATGMCHERYLQN